MHTPDSSILFDTRLGARPSKPRLESSPAKPIRVVAVDDHFAVRAALIDTVQSQADMVLIGVASSTEEARDLIESTRPDVAVVDINLGDASGLDLIEELHREHAYLKTIVFSIFEEEIYAERARMAGARGYVTKNESTQRVIEAIRAVAGGGTFFARRSAPTGPRKKADGSGFKPGGEKSEREG